MPRMAVYRPAIGLEVHAELLTNAKMFCGCPVVDLTTAEANTAICEVCTGTPGTLPVLNGRAVELALSVALALNCSIAETSQFARKNYFYPDLPKGYQISQYELPLASQGHIILPREAGEKLVRIRRVHLEEDTGKLLHTPHSTLIDYNRSGVPLLEIVTEPDLESVEEAGLYASWLRILLRTLGANSGDMEKGVIRFEANVSVQPEGSEALGTRTEIKNLNSFRAMLRSISYELERQTALLDSGQSVRQETLGWDEQSGTTHSQRSKEEAHDYRYFPEPDLPPLVVSRDWIHRLRDALPELPAARLRRFQREYALRLDQAQLLIEQPAIADYFEAVVRLADSSPPTGIAQWITGELFALLHASGRTFDDPSLLPPAALAELISLVEAGRINLPTAKAVLAEVFEAGGSPADLVRQRGLEQVQDHGAIQRLVADALLNHPDQVRQYLAGKHTLQQWFFGQVMRASGGRTDPSLVQQELAAQLAALEENPPGA
jgi:aspartyl-tRNA(Asn)/glutamyl-tRNA(Gln) amidotransferase subunit B